ncbi:Ras-related protein Rab11A [Histomonas meleagridis]|uniref:Ras-related protein Rab11A n=1 Tax=Histomonas meleagridis TaxID=135588 RepID=UPI0035595239|nr:Ras-related protein Rab11A [Histomonas meleagridis]KAH0799854.1 Ras-related protein Rab11A [Histomonas meleagridis]
MESKYDIKVILSGEFTTGRTCFIFRLIDSVFPDQGPYFLPNGQATKTYEIEGKTLTFQIYDVMGSADFREQPPSYYQDAMGAIILYDITNEDTFQKVPFFIQEVRRYADSKAVIMLIGSKCDLENDRKISTSEGAELSKREGLIFYEASPINGTNVHEAFAAMATKILHVLEGKEEPKQTNNKNGKDKSICNLS